MLRMVLSFTIARVSAPPGKAKVSPTRVPGSGTNTSGSSAKRARAGSSSKTCRSFDLADWKSCSGASHRSGILLGTTVYPRAGLAPLTGGTGSGSLPTPAASMADRGGRGDLIQVARGNTSPSGHFGRQWPTPTASLNSARDTRPKPSAVGGSHGWSLAGAAIDAAAEIPLETWPTTRSGLASAATLARNSRPLNEVAAQREGRGMLNPVWVGWLMGVPPDWLEAVERKQRSG